MPARIFLVHDQPALIADAAMALRNAGYDIADFADALAALEALENDPAIELLITRVQFAPGSQNGVSLALMARQKRPSIKILFADHPEFQESTEGVGEFLATPPDIAALVATVGRLLEPGDAA